MVGYVRVSTAEQGDSGAGLEAQEAAIRAECSRRGWRLIRLETDVLSGRTLRRPGLNRALRAVRTGEAAGLVVAKLDRLSRSVVDFGKLLQEATKSGWNIVALDFGVDLSTPPGKLVANVMVSVAEWERDVIAQRTREALAVKRSQGVQLGRPRVLEESVRRRIRILRGRGWSYQRMADDLNRRGVPTAHGGRQWHAATVRAAASSRRQRSSAGVGKRTSP